MSAENSDDGCLFPSECCMPGIHTSDECHTAEMLLQQEYEARLGSLKQHVDFLEGALKNVGDALFRISRHEILAVIEENLRQSKEMNHEPEPVLDLQPRLRPAPDPEDTSPF